MIGKGDIGTFFDAAVEDLLAFYRPVKEASQKHDLPIIMAHGVFPMHCDVAPSLDDYLIAVTEKMLAVCRYLECPRLVVHPVTLADQSLEEEMTLAMYRRLIPAAKKYGVMICLENMFHFKGGRAICRACADMNEAYRYIDALNAEAGEELFGFCYDVGHTNVTCDTTTDWEAFLRGLKEIGYEGPLNFETAAAIEKMPEPIVKPLLRFTCEVGEYFRSELTK